MAKRKRTYKKSKKTASKIDLVVVTLIMLGILLGVLIYTKSGVIGLKLNEILGGMIGVMQYILPIGIVVIAIKLAYEGSENLISKLIQYAVLIVSLCVALSVFQISTGELSHSKDMQEVIKNAYFLGSQSKGGGACRSISCHAAY